MSVKQLRTQRGWSQEHLAQASGVSYRTIQRVEAGKRASFDTLKALAAVFETDINRIRQEPEMQPLETTPNKNKDMAEEYELNIKAYKISFFAFIFISPLLYILNTILTPSFLWAFIVALAWGVSFVLHAIAIKVLFGVFDLKMTRTDYDRYLKQSLK